SNRSRHVYRVHASLKGSYSLLGPFVNVFRSCLHGLLSHPTVQRFYVKSNCRSRRLGWHVSRWVQWNKRDRSALDESVNGKNAEPQILGRLFCGHVPGPEAVGELSVVRVSFTRIMNIHDEPLARFASPYFGNRSPVNRISQLFIANLPTC